VLDFCQKGIDHAQRNGHAKVTEQDILDAEHDFSESLFRSITLEFRALFPSLDEVLIEFAGAPVTMLWKEFESRAIEAIAKHTDLIAGWHSSNNPNPDYLASVLFKIGVIGFTKPGSPSNYFANGRSFAETWSLVSPAPEVVVHPAFIRSLDISPELSQRTRSRTSRESDRRQIRMDLPDVPAK